MMTKMRLNLALTCLLLIVGNSYTKEISREQQGKAVSLPIETCTALNNCQEEQTGLVIDFHWTGCTDPKACTYIPTEDVYVNGWGVVATGSDVLLTFDKGGSRTYFTTGPNSDQYRMFQLLNKELSFDIETSTIGCGMNFALYFISMEADGGKASSGFSGAQYGTGYCDAQGQGREACPEFDIWEANSLATVYTNHPCDANGCDRGGCGINTYSRGNKTFYGRGNGFAVDSTRPFTVVTQFVTVDGTDNGDLKEIRRYYIQDGRRINSPSINGYDSISDAYCASVGSNNVNGGVTQGMSPALRKGMVLSLALWGSASDTNSMTWLDNEPNGPCPIYQNLSPRGTFGNFKVGAIGSTNPV